MFQAWTLSIVERVARKAACPAHGDTLRVHASSESQGGKAADGVEKSELHTGVTPGFLNHLPRLGARVAHEVVCRACVHVAGHLGHQLGRRGGLLRSHQLGERLDDPRRRGRRGPSWPSTQQGRPLGAEGGYLSALGAWAAAGRGTCGQGNFWTCRRASSSFAAASSRAQRPCPRKHSTKAAQKCAQHTATAGSRVAWKRRTSRGSGPASGSGSGLGSGSGSGSG